LLGAVRFGKPRTREHNRRAQKRKEGGLWTAYSRGQSAGARVVFSLYKYHAVAVSVQALERPQRGPRVSLKLYVVIL
jgi:hypothetical protein